MPLDKTSPLATGDLIEARVAQCWFWEGYFVRSGIDLQTQFGAESIQVTDLDLLAFSFGPNLETRKLIGEAKSGGSKSAPKPLDRVIWLRGLRSLVAADAAELTIKLPATVKVRELGRHLGVSVQSISDLEAREDAVSVIEVADVGAYGPTAISLRNAVRNNCQNDPTLQAAYRYLRSAVWFLDPFSAAKQTLGLLASLGTRWTSKVEDSDKTAVRWLIAEAVSVLAFNLVVIAGHMSPMSPRTFAEYVSDRLADGIVPAAKLRVLSTDIDKFVSGLLSAAHAPAPLRISAMGAFEPEPPEFAGSLAELAIRIKVSADGSQLARKVETLVHERLVRKREPSPVVTARLDLPTESHSSIAAFAAFLRTYADLPSELSAALTEPVGFRRQRAPESSLNPRALSEGAQAVSSAHVDSTESTGAKRESPAKFEGREPLFELPPAPAE